MRIEYNSQHMNVWLTSDTHYGHTNIVSGVSSWDDTSQCRKFKTVAEMNDTIVKTFHKHVKHGDIVIHHGDWSFGGSHNIQEFFKKLPSVHFLLVLGNHDHNITKLPSSDMRDMFDLGVIRSGHVRIQDMSLIKQPVDLFVSHYKHFVWEGSHKGYVHTYGHSHATAEHHVIGKSMDVGIDNAFRLTGEYRPFNLNEVLELMSKRDIHYVDHHTKDTNVR